MICPIVARPVPKPIGVRKMLKSAVTAVFEGVVFVAFMGTLLLWLVILVPE